MLQTDRLYLSAIALTDADFMLALVNTPQWITFIGQRNVANTSDAAAYIQKILDASTTSYWTIRLQATGQPIGVVSLIKRAYLEHHDIGFALLPAYTQQGFALEATAAVLSFLKDIHTTILAIVMPSNQQSVRLLDKLGFVFCKAITPDNELLWLYQKSLIPA
jgi:RimJ/RimL family protein N-acetyltransferase